MRYMVVIEKGTSSYGAFVPDLPGCIAVGETEAEALSLIEEAIQFHLEDMKAGGLQIPPPASKSTFIKSHVCENPSVHEGDETARF